MKILVVGGVAAGASAAARCRRLDPHAKIIVFEKGRDVSFSNCSLPYYLSDVIKKADDLILMTPAAFKKQHDIEVRVNSEVIKILRKEKKVQVKSESGIYEETYDKLILAQGASPIMPGSIKGIEMDHVFALRNVEDIVKIKQASAKAHDIAVIGGGFIGLEVAENLVKAQKKVHLIEGLDQVMAPIDPDMAAILHKELYDQGVDVHLSSMLKEIKKGEVIASKKGEELNIKADLVIMAIGVAPVNDLCKDAMIELGQSGGVLVDVNYRTNDHDIYAVGDMIESFNALTHSPGRLALAGPAQRQARAAVDHIYGQNNPNKGFVGASCLRLFNLNVASVGLNEKTLKASHYHYDAVVIYPSDKVSLMPKAHYMVFKLLFEVPSGKILGAQAIGGGDVTKRIDVISTLIQMGGDLYDLKDLELCYAPLYSTAKDVTNMAALVALNILHGVYKQVPVSKVRELVENKALIIDVRERSEFEKGHLINARNIPLSELRKRYKEIPQDVPVYLHCRSAQRSYYALCFLKGMGYDKLYNISGSFLGISLYEYFKDVSENRDRILTEYNFD